MVFEITLYRHGSTWLFDDDTRGIKAEPFVMGASEVIQKYLDRKGLGKRKKGVIVEFSTELIDNADLVLTCIKKHRPMKLSETQRRFGNATHVHLSNVSSLFNFEIDENAEPTSADYIDQEGQQCWLCPAQLKFFGSVADVIYARFK